MSLFEGFKPRQDLSGYTALPNEFFDSAISEIDSVSELKVVLAVFRKTYGWVASWSEGRPIYKVEDAISYSQFQELTGLASKTSIKDGIDKAMRHGFIVRVKEGNYLGESARYRIRTIGTPPDEPDDELPPITQVVPGTEEELLPIPQDVPGQTSTYSISCTDNININTNKNINTSKVPPIPKDVLPESLEGDKTQPSAGFAPEEREVFSTKDIAPAKSRGQKMWESFLEKTPEQYNTNDLCFYFTSKFERILSVKYGGVTNKDRSLMKKLMDSYGSVDTVKAIDYLLANYRKWVDSPTIGVLYGFRNSIFPEALSEKMKVDVRQPHFEKDEGGGVTW